MVAPTITVGTNPIAFIAGTAPAASAFPTPTPAGSAPDIYEWLPFSQASLAKAASVTEAFGAAYDTFSYRESASSYQASLRGLTTSELSATLEAIANSLMVEINLSDAEISDRAR